MTKRELKRIDLTVRERRVVDFMIDNKGICSLEAFQTVGETRLSAVIFNLKNKGIPVNSEWLTVKNRYNENRRVKYYYIG